MDNIPSKQKPSYNVNVDGIDGFAVSPKEDCPHYQTKYFYNLSTLLNQFVTNKVLEPNDFFKQKCQKCEENNENWLCLTCQDVGCSRYKSNHMVRHYNEKDHPIVLSFSDFSFWCYKCDSYITNKDLQNFQKLLSQIRFGDNSEFEKLTTMLEKMQIGEQLIEGIKSKQFKNVVFLTGAGISVAAGIPDFRTPGTGLYSKLESLNLPYPEAIFHIGFFKQNPLPFYKFAGEFLNSMKVKPVQAHKFIKKFQDNQQLLLNFTQNIDGLELDAGINPDRVLQAHGHMRSAHCTDCKKECDVSLFLKAIVEQNILKCAQCGSGLVKPDIVFFGESLPQSFFQGTMIMSQADLVFIMGTSLKVAPFSMLPTLIQSPVPIVTINRESVYERENSLLLAGDIEDVVRQLCLDLEWDL